MPYNAVRFQTLYSQPNHGGPECTRYSDHLMEVGGVSLNALVQDQMHQLGFWIKPRSYPPRCPQG
jgi:hypothetical protein